MTQAELSQNGVSLIFQEEGGSYTLHSGPFTLKNCRPRLTINGADAAFGALKIEKADAKKITAKAESEFGVWTFTFELKRNAALELNLKGKLKKSVVSL